MNKYINVTVVVFSFVIVQLPPCLSELRRIQHLVSDNGSLMFLGMGDWGRRGKYSQKNIAKQMGKVADNFSLEFIITTGDNFYGDDDLFDPHKDGLNGVEDYAFTASFKNVYKAKSLQQLRFYTVLGNHDYLNSIEAQLSRDLRKKDARWRCYRSYVVNAGIADFFFVDTTPFVNSYYHERKDYSQYDFGPSRWAYYDQLLNDVQSALQKSEARWKIVVGHHPIRSVGEHGDTEELVQLLLPILEANNVDFYINGHDHCMQRVEIVRPNAIQFITTGGGSLAWTGEARRGKRSNENIFYYPQVGFMMARITHTNTYVAFFDEHGKVFYHWTTHKSN